MFGVFIMLRGSQTETEFHSLKTRLKEVESEVQKLKEKLKIIILQNNSSNLQNQSLEKNLFGRKLLPSMEMKFNRSIISYIKSQFKG